MPEEVTGVTAVATPHAPWWRRRRVVAVAGGAVVLVAAAGTGAALASGSSAAPPVIPAARAYPSAVAVLAAMDSKGAVCSGAGQAGQFADCSADSNGDTVIGIPSSQSSGTGSGAAAPAQVTVVNSDTFAFALGGGAPVTDSGANNFGHDGLPWASGNPEAEFLHDASASQWAHDGQGTLGADAANFHWSDGHAGHFLIH